MRLLVLAAAGALLTAPASAADCASTAGALTWPDPAWRELPADPARLEVQGLDAYLFPPGLDEAAREGVRTNGLVIVKDGTIVHERYARGFGPEMPHIAWSVTKSVLHALYGAAVRDGLVTSTGRSRSAAPGSAAATRPGSPIAISSP